MAKVGALETFRVSNLTRWGSLGGALERFRVFDFSLPRVLLLVRGKVGVLFTRISLWYSWISEVCLFVCLFVCLCICLYICKMYICLYICLCDRYVVVAIANTVIVKIVIAFKIELKELYLIKSVYIIL